MKFIKSIKKYAAEMFGTAVLLFFGIGAAIFAGSSIGYVGVSFAFGIAVMAAVYGIGHISGAHLNPAVSLGAFLAGRMKVLEMVKYILSQLIGAIIGVALVYFIITQFTSDYSLATYGLGENYVMENGLVGALVFETIATFIFVTVVLCSTSKRNPNATHAGIAIGFTLVAIHLIGIPLTGVSVNPARSMAPALFVGGDALKSLWVFIVAPLLGGALAGGINRLGAKAE